VQFSTTYCTCLRRFWDNWTAPECKTITRNIWLTDDLESTDNSHEMFCLLGYYCTRRRMVVSDRRFGTTCRPRPEGSSSLAFFLDCLTLEDGTGRLFRNVGKNSPFYTAYSKIPKEPSSHLCRGGSLKTYFSANFPSAMAIAPPIHATRYTEVSSRHSHPYKVLFIFACNTAQRRSRF
jgi:hypothetical protein